MEQRLQPVSLWLLGPTTPGTQNPWVPMTRPWGPSRLQRLHYSALGTTRYGRGLQYRVKVMDRAELDSHTGPSREAGRQLG